MIYSKQMKNKKLLLVLCFLAVLIAAGVFMLKPGKQDSLLSNPPITQPKIVAPSETLKEYQDPSGFSFNYPDNLSITKNDITDNNTYADLQLFSKDVNGSLILKITDSKFTTLDEWLKSNKEATVGEPKEVKLGSLKAFEIKTSDRLLVAALDQKILFTIEIPLVEEDFWMKVYNKILTGFTFELPDNTTASANTNVTSDDVIFEGEEVVE